MNELQVFSYNNTEIRTVQKDGEVWWVLKDVCDVLELSNTNRVAERLEADELTLLKLISGGQNREMICINESGLYNVLIRSDKPAAVPFRRWVTHEVLPSIRKHGAYMTPDTLEKALLNPDTIIQIATALKAEQEKSRRLELENNMQQQIIGELQPKANYVDIILNNKSLVSITQIAKDYGMSGTAMNKLLNRLGVQFKQSGQWLLYSRYQGFGYTHSKTIDIIRSDGRRDVTMETKWTQKGRLFLYEKLKANGIIPMIEQEMPA